MTQSRDARGHRGPTSGINFLIMLVLPLVPTGLATAEGGAPSACREYWVVSTRAVPQLMGTDPWPCLRASRLASSGCLARRDPAELVALSAGRPVIILVHGSYYRAGLAASEGLQIADDLARLGATRADSLVVAFDWPSQVVLPNPIQDANEKARRAFVAGYHLARFLQMFPSGARVCLIGQSHGGLVVLSTLHLLGGGTLNGDGPCSTSRLAEATPALHLRAVVIAAACDRQWLDPDDRFGRALAASEGVLCLYNPLDPVLVVHPFGRYSDHQPALGKTGMTPAQEACLGPLSVRYRERNIAHQLGPRHTFRGSTDRPPIARAIACYTWTT